MTLQPLPDLGTMTRWVEVLAPARQLAEVIAQTEFVPKAMRGKPDVVTAAIMYGDELALGPMQALQGIDVIEGRPRPSAELVRALVYRAGHSLTVHEMTGTRCRVSGLRGGRPESERLTIEWTLDMAKAAGLLGKTNWRAYPRAMLLARAMSDLGRVLFPDVIKGLGYIAETSASAEALEAWHADGTEPAPENLEPAKPKRVVQRRTKPTPAPAPEIGPSGPTGPPEPASPVVEDPPPMAGDTPEQPDDEPPAEGGVPMANVSQLRALYTKMGVLLGTGTDSDYRRQAIADLVGRPLESTKELTREEVFRLRGMLMRVGAGVAGLSRTGPGGAWEVVDIVADPSDPDDPWAQPQVNTETGELFEPDRPGNSGRDRI